MTPVTSPIVLRAVVLAICSGSPTPAAPPSSYPVTHVWEGVVSSIVDGDGLFVAGVEVRLQGIAAPEDNARRRDRGGREATEALRRLALKQRVTCYADGTRSRQRIIARCELPGGQNLGEELVRAGLARDCPRYFLGDYAASEALARRDGTDLSRIYALPSYCRRR